MEGKLDYKNSNDNLTTKRRAYTPSSTPNHQGLKDISFIPLFCIRDQPRGRCLVVSLPRLWGNSVYELKLETFKSFKPLYNL